MRQRCFLILLAASAATAEPSLIRDVTLDRIEFAGISQDRIQFAIIPRIVTARSATIREIHFSETYLGAIPVYLPPILETIEARSSQTIERRLVVTIYFRDLESIEELRRIVGDGRAVAKGKAVAEVGLSLMQSLAVRSRTALAPFNFEHEIPVAFPGGALSRYGALGLLRTVEAAASIAEIGRQHLGLDDNPYADWVIPVAARFEIEDGTGRKQTGEAGGYAVRHGARGLMIVRELAAPWEYDADLAVALQSKRVKVVKDSYELVAGPYSSKRDEIRMVRTSKAKVEYTTMRHPAAGNKSIRIAERASTSNLTYWELQKDLPEAGRYDIASTAWERLAVFRGNGIVYLRGRRDQDRILLDDPIDSRSKGSAVIGLDGIAGILQNEWSALPAQVALDALELPAK
jgi:hypothetical protein